MYYMYLRYGTPYVLNENERRRDFGVLAAQCGLSVRTPRRWEGADPTCHGQTDAADSHAGAMQRSAVHCCCIDGQLADHLLI